MACDDKWKEHLVGKLFGDLDPAAAQLLEAHLEDCADCRAELGQLATARQWLGEATPTVPAFVPRTGVFVTTPLRRPRLAFAAGFACAALLLSSGFLAGRALTPQAAGPPARIAQDAAGAPPLTLRELQDALGDYRARLEQLARENDELSRFVETQRTRPVIYRDEFQNRLSEFGQVLDLRRESDLDYLMEQIVDVRLQTDTRLGEQQEALRYLLLAGDPRLTEQ